MQKEILLEILAQNRFTCSFAFNKLTPENASFRLTGQAASAGFIYRHIGETINIFGLFFGMPTDVKNTTMGQTDTGQAYPLDESQRLIERGYERWKNLIGATADDVWLEMIYTPFFGKVSKVRLFAHVLFHNSHHAGQISLTLAKGCVQ